MKSTSFRSLHRGFTLVELLIVISIITILTGIIITSLTGSKAKSRDAQRVSDINQIQFALEQYFDRCGVYPKADSTNGGPAKDECSTGGTTVTINSYITKIPQDPVTKKNYDYAVNDSNYPTDYVLHATLEGRNQVQENSLPESVRSSTSNPDNGWMTWSGAGQPACYDAGAHPLEYCITTH